MSDYRSKHPVMREFHVGEEANGFLVRLRWEPWESRDGLTGWVDFELFEVIGMQDDGKHMYHQKGYSSSPDQYTLSPDEAEMQASGFVKWDGCTQFNTDDGVHVDGKADMEAFLEALRRARADAMEAMQSEFD
jgi:hypothetical protein